MNKFNILSKKKTKTKGWNYTGIKPDFISVNDINRLLSSIKNPKHYILFMLLAKTGKRVSEVLALKVSDIDFENKGIKFKILKKKHPYVQFFPINDDMLTELETYLMYMKSKKRELVPDDYLFKSYGIKIRNTPHHMKRQQAHRLAKKYGLQAGVISKTGATSEVKQLHCHTFRHAYVKGQLENCGNNLSMVAQIMAHSGTASTEKYLNYTDSERAKKILEYQKKFKSSSKE